MKYFRTLSILFVITISMGSCGVTQTAATSSDANLTMEQLQHKIDSINRAHDKKDIGTAD